MHNFANTETVLALRSLDEVPDTAAVSRRVISSAPRFIVRRAPKNNAPPFCAVIQHAHTTHTH